MPLLVYRLLLFAKLAAVLVYAAGSLVCVFTQSFGERRRAVHRIASPALLLVWVLGCVLASSQGVALSELWLLGGLVGSFLSLAALVVSLHVAGGRGWAVFGIGVLLGVLALMVFRPTWEVLR